MQAERWALLGNAVSIPVAKWLGERLMLPFRHKYCVGPLDRPLLLPPRAPAQQQGLRPASAAAAEELAQEIKGVDFDWVDGGELFAFTMRHKGGLLPGVRGLRGLATGSGYFAPI